MMPNMSPEQWLQKCLVGYQHILNRRIGSSQVNSELLLETFELQVGSWQYSIIISYAPGIR